MVGRNPTSLITQPPRSLGLQSKRIAFAPPAGNSAYYLYSHFLSARAPDRSELAWWPYSSGVIYIDLMHATSAQLDPGPILQTARRVSTAEGEGNRPGIRPDVSGLFHGTRRHLRLSGLLLKC